MAKTPVFWLNAFPVMGGGSQDLSPCATITGQQVDYKHHGCFQFREYVQTHEELNNSMNPRTVGGFGIVVVLLLLLDQSCCCIGAVVSILVSFR